MLKAKRTYFIGVPAVIVAGLLSLLLWGLLQPKPPGFAPTDPAAEAVATESVVEEVAVAATDAAVDLPVRYTVDARSREGWAFFDFARGQVVETSMVAVDWDLAFRRTKLLTNSGATNPLGTTGVAKLGEVPLETASVPANASFAVDELGGEDGDELRNPAISRWYHYSFIRHVVDAKPDVYIVRTHAGTYAAVSFVSYYCDDGSAGCVTFLYRVLAE